MSNSKAIKRKRRAEKQKQGSKIPKTSSTATAVADVSVTKESGNLSSLISEEELEITVDTLLTLAEHPGLIKSKACKDLRAAVYDFRQSCTTGVNAAATSLTARLSAALADSKYSDALVLLAEMRIRNEMPKLGALCRWVRDLDVVSGLFIQADGVMGASAPRTKEGIERLRVLDAVLRVTGPLDLNPESVGWSSSNTIVPQSIWSLRAQGRVPIPIRQSVLDKTIFKALPKGFEGAYEAIETTPGPQRKPPNLHPAIVYLTADNAVPLSQNAPQITHHKHPVVPNLSLIKDVLSPDECTSIIAAAESIGFLADAPIRDDGSQSSILAHNVYWMVDQAFHDALWERVRHFVPSDVAGKVARGINRRFRVYRYVPGAEYRCHIDGAWPPSGVHPVTKAYIYDGSPEDAKQSSLFTFLIYLNEEFEGGETTFFLPSIKEGVLNAYSVHPVMGSVAMFPHGETMGALLHEGTGVRKGAKYVIRTDVEYDVEPTLGTTAS